MLDDFKRIFMSRKLTANIVKNLNSKKMQIRQ